MNKQTKLLLGCAAWLSSAVWSWGTVTDTYILLEGTSPGIPSPYASSTGGIRFVWDPVKRHFQAGKGNPGQAQVGQFSFMFGRGLGAPGEFGWSAGRNNTSSGDHSYTFGYHNTAAGSAAIAMGEHSTAAAAHGLAIGSYALVEDIAGIALGVNVTSSADYATVIGRDNDSDGAYSFVAGGYNTVSGLGSVSLGRFNTVSPDSPSSNAAYAIGEGLHVEYPGAFVVGKYNAAARTPSSAYLFVVGNGIYGDAGDAFTVDAYGNAWTAGSFSSSGGGQMGQLYTGLTNVGIGISSPAVKLDVKGTVAAGGNTGITSGAEIGRFSFHSRDTDTAASGERGYIRLVNDSGAAWNGTQANEDSAMEFYTMENRTTHRKVMRLTSTGRVGIGTDQPLSKLHIQQSGEAQLQIGENAGASWKFWGGNNLHIRKSNDEETMIIWQNKNITMGTDGAYKSAHSKLHVRGGDIRFSYNYGIRVGPENDSENWGTGTTHLIRTYWDGKDNVDYYVPGSQRADPVIQTNSDGVVTVNGTLRITQVQGDIPVGDFD